MQRLRLTTPCTRAATTRLLTIAHVPCGLVMESVRRQRRSHLAFPNNSEMRPMPANRLRKNVFVSYSHQDREWLERLKVHLAPYLRGEALHLWDDTKIKPGSSWAADIQQEIDNARAAILLVTPTFLASNYIFEVELPRILSRASSDLAVLWVPVAPSAYEATPLAQIQALHDPTKPLSTLSLPKQDAALVEISNRIVAVMDINAIGNSLRMIDEFTPQVNAFLTGQPEPDEAPTFGQRAEQSSLELNLVDHGSIRKLIDAGDLLKLDSNSQKLIRSYERTMKELFERWTELKVKRIAQDPEIRAEAIEQANFVRCELCAELTDLLGFIESMGMSLQDHYHHVRYLCRPAAS